jgi:hypothetical protein
MQGIRFYSALCVAIWQVGLAESTPGAPPTAPVAESDGKNANNTNQPPPISVAIKTQGGPGQIPASRAYITAGTNKFAFLVPGEFKLAGCDPQKVTLMKRDGSCLISVRVVGPPPGNGKPFDCAAARELLKEEHPDANISREFGMAAGGASGPAFEIQWGTGVLTRSSHVGFIPFRAGLLEFSVDASADKLAPSLGDFNSVILTFRASDENGKLEATPLSDSI